MNVRCPHCSAVFPVQLGPERTQAVECPLCLLRFEPNSEQTISAIPAATTAPRAAGLAEEEFEQFGLGSSTRTVRPVELAGQLRTPRSQSMPNQVGFDPPSAQPAGGQTQAMKGAGISLPSTARSGPMPAVVHQMEDIDVDFDALLSDAAAAVGRSGDQRTNPFVRIGGSRSGSGQAEESVFAPGKQGAGVLGPPPFGAAASPPSPALGSRGNLGAFDGGIGSRAGSGPAPAQGASPFAIGTQAPEEDSLFESGARLAGASDGELGPHSGADSSANVDSFSQPRAPNVGSSRPAPSSKKKGRPSGPSFDQLLLAAMVVAGAGLATDYAGLGLFASQLWKSSEPAARKVERPVPPDLQRAVLLDDTQRTYELELARLDRLTQLRPDDAALARSRAAVYLDLWERFPEAMHQEDVKAGLEQLKASGTLPAVRVTALEALAQGNATGALAQLDALRAGSADDRGVAARALLGDFRQRLRRQALDNPGLTSAPEVDPLRAAGAGDAKLEEAAKLAADAAQQGKDAVNAAKFVLLRAEILDALGQPAQVQALAEPLAKRTPLQHEARLLLASAALDQGKVEEARVALDHVAAAEASGDVSAGIPERLQAAYARMAGRLGDSEAQSKALAKIVTAAPTDELSTIRLARLLVADRHLDDANKLLQAAKRKQNFKSVGFEVALVEYWLAVNRNEDALEEIREATKTHPASPELLYLRGQVEDKQAHFATARDYFAQVLQRQPRHLRSAIRLAELQAAAGRHDESLATLERARAQVGDEETILRLIAEELSALRRLDEARQVLGKLLQAYPDNRRYLLQAARLDLREGRSEQALESLRRLRDQKALDRDGAVQMALALAEKQSYVEAAQVLEPFADQALADIELHALAGRFLLDVGALDRAAVYVQRAVQVANGKSAEALFQYGRLAFKRGEVGQGISRMKQAIEIDKLSHQYRFELARFLLEVKGDPSARKVAIEELETIVRSADGLAKADHPVRNLVEVHRLLARGLGEGHDYAKAAKHWQEAVALDPADVDSRAELGKALYFLRDPKAAEVLRAVLALKPGSGKGNLYLGLHLLGARRSAEALPLLQKAAQSGDASLSEAWFHAALIQKERGNLKQALHDVSMFLEAAPAGSTYRADAESLRKTLQAALSGKQGK